MNILEEANNVVTGDRRKAYGSPKDNMEHIARIYNSITRNKNKLTAEDVALIMIATKLARESHAHKRDNLVDLAGYAYVLNEVKEK